ncbi:MAG: ribosome-associated translation inhibitor RaiA [Firmicutes bacterium]|nr:ribosome-associated translation inhibitor RaiA [Bacillota bacterium]
MRYTFTGKNTTVTDGIREKFTAKLNRIAKLFPEDTTATVTISVVKLDHTIEVTVNLPKRVLRAEVTSQDMYSGIDEIVDILENQMIKYKNRLRDKSRRDNSFADELKAFALSEDDAPQESDDSVKISRSKRFFVKPMDAEEAILEMELLGHNFFVFRDAKSEEINVVYKRKNGTYGLIEPEN